jgi:hypothetical protein
MSLMMIIIIYNKKMRSTNKILKLNKKKMYIFDLNNVILSKKLMLLNYLFHFLVDFTQTIFNNFIKAMIIYNAIFQQIILFISILYKYFN